MLPPEVRFSGLNAPNSILAGAPPQTAGGAYSATPDLRGLLLGGEDGREGKRKGAEEKEGKGRGGNVQFHHLLLCNLTTALQTTSDQTEEFTYISLNFFSHGSPLYV